MRSRSGFDKKGHHRQFYLDYLNLMLILTICYREIFYLHNKRKHKTSSISITIRMQMRSKVFTFIVDDNIVSKGEETTKFPFNRRRATKKVKVCSPKNNSRRGSHEDLEITSHFQRVHQESASS